jgi:uncharacterized SAM-binding protein YcdF (DUF218 family)
MADQAQTSVEQILLRRRLRYLGRMLAWTGAMIAGAFVVVALLILVQGRYPETRRADAIVVLLQHCELMEEQEPQPSEEPCGVQELQYALNLYRRAYASHIVLVDREAEPAYTYLLGQGFPEQSLLQENQFETRVEQFAHLADEMRAHGMSSLLVVGHPHEILLALKMTRDLGLQSYGEPLPPVSRLDLPLLLQESYRYWRYVLFGL